MLYSILSKIRLKPNWPKIKRYYECREEMLKQFDVLYLYKRVNFLEKSLGCMLEEYQLKGMHLTEQITLD